MLSNAEMFASDANAASALRRHDLPVPPQLQPNAIAQRHFLNGMALDGANTVKFLDGSTVHRNQRGYWTPLDTARESG